MKLDTRTPSPMGKKYPFLTLGKIRTKHSLPIPLYTIIHWYWLHCTFTMCYSKLQDAMADEQEEGTSHLLCFTTLCAVKLYFIQQYTLVNQRHEKKEGRSYEAQHIRKCPCAPWGWSYLAMQTEIKITREKKNRIRYSGIYGFFLQNSGL